MRHCSFAPLALALAALFIGAPSWAGGDAGRFGVRIALSQGAGSVGPAAPGASSFAPLLPPSGLCRSRTLSDTASASVEVSCESGQFVSIAPDPEASYFGLRDVFRYPLSFHTELSVWYASPMKGDVPRFGWGTVTALRLYDLSPPNGRSEAGWDWPLDMLVTF